jgi:pimeloyl-ACP methyl ester carboxylesterase
VNGGRPAMKAPQVFPRSCGLGGPLLVLLHGGPGAPGELEPVGRELADRFRVLETAERRAPPSPDEEPLSVASHVADLRALLRARARPDKPFLIGHSSGAIIALAYAAAHPATVRGVVLVGCATMGESARTAFRAALQVRLDATARAALRAADAVPDRDEALRRRASALLPAYSVDLLTTHTAMAYVDARGHDQTWADMLRLQAFGEHPAAFRRIRAPVVMLHGEEDPHPGKLIRESLQAVLPGLEYIGLPKCGHYPWLERAARERFYTELRRWLAAH